MRYLPPVLLLLLTLLAGCLPALPPTPNAIALPSAIPAHGMVDIPLPPNGSPEAAPTMLLKIQIYDDVTGEKLEGNVFWSPLPVWMGVQGQDLKGLGIHGIDMPLGSEADGWLAVAVPGYQLWKLKISYRIKTSRVLEIPVRMQHEVKGEQL